MGKLPLAPAAALRLPLWGCHPHPPGVVAPRPHDAYASSVLRSASAAAALRLAWWYGGVLYILIIPICHSSRFFGVVVQVLALWRAWCVVWLGFFVFGMALFIM
ncbi:MAG: hypothetical protein CL932_18330 [Deltaproteobacteria bacterium]|nr:hypothetical protein [Deltaproteobacteria bacterium]